MKKSSLFHSSKKTRKSWLFDSSRKRKKFLLFDSSEEIRVFFDSEEKANVSFAWIFDCFQKKRWLVDTPNQPKKPRLVGSSEKAKKAWLLDSASLPQGLFLTWQLLPGLVEATLVPSSESAAVAFSVGQLDL